MVVLGTALPSLRYDQLFPLRVISFCWLVFGGGLIKESYR